MPKEQEMARDDEESVLHMMELMEGERTEADDLLDEVIAEMEQYTSKGRLCAALVFDEGVGAGEAYMMLAMLKQDMGVSHFKLSEMTTV